MKKKEILILSCIALLALLVLLFTNFYSANKEDLYLLITVDGHTHAQMPLGSHTNTDPIIIEASSGYNVYTIENGVVNVIDANCPDLVCVHTVPASKAGEMIVCLPHKVVLEIKSGDINED